MRETIVAMMQRIATESGKTLDATLAEETPLLQSGLDSLDFAILVARLERELGEDPFAALETPVYPKTLGELTNIYESHFQN
ncbi:MAG: acyl carrier protein [Planctomycetota bacterium]